jgi:hypothetical protein
VINSALHVQGSISADTVEMDGLATDLKSVLEQMETSITDMEAQIVALQAGSGGPV